MGRAGKLVKYWEKHSWTSMGIIGRLAAPQVMGRNLWKIKNETKQKAEKRNHKRKAQKIAKNTNA